MPQHMANQQPCATRVLIHVLNERVDSYRYLGFHFHATKNMSYGVSHLVSAARKAVHALRRRCATRRTVCWPPVGPKDTKLID